MTTPLLGEREPQGTSAGAGTRAPFPPSPSFHPPLKPVSAVAKTLELETVAPPDDEPLARAAPAGPLAPGETQPLPRPVSPQPSPWLASRPFALRAMVLGMAAAATVFAGMAIFGVALAWHASMTRLAEVALMIVGGYLISLGVAYVVSVSPDAPARS